MEYNHSDYGHEYDYDRLDAAIESISQLTTSIPGIFKQLTSFKEELEEIKNNAISPGAQFLLMYFLGMLDKNFKSNKTDAKILKVLLNNGNHDDFRHWLSECQDQIKTIRALGSDTDHYEATQPFTLRNLNKVCEILEQHKLEQIFVEPFDLRDKVESFQK